MVDEDAGSTRRRDKLKAVDDEAADRAVRRDEGKGDPVGASSSTAVQFDDGRTGESGLSRAVDGHRAHDRGECRNRSNRQGRAGEVEADRIGSSLNVGFFDRGPQGALSGSVIANAVSRVRVTRVGQRIDDKSGQNGRLDGARPNLVPGHDDKTASSVNVQTHREKSNDRRVRLERGSLGEPKAGCARCSGFNEKADPPILWTGNGDRVEIGLGHPRGEEGRPGHALQVALPRRRPHQSTPRALDRPPVGKRGRFETVRCESTDFAAIRQKRNVGRVGIVSNEVASGDCDDGEREEAALDDGRRNRRPAEQVERESPVSPVNQKDFPPRSGHQIDRELPIEFTEGDRRHGRRSLESLRNGTACPFRRLEDEERST